MQNKILKIDDINGKVYEIDNWKEKLEKYSKTKYLVLHVITQKNLQLMQLKIMQVILLLDLFLNQSLSKMQ